MKFLDLKPIDKHRVSIKTFGNQILVLHIEVALLHGKTLKQFHPYTHYTCEVRAVRNAPQKPMKSWTI